MMTLYAAIALLLPVVPLAWFAWRTRQLRDFADQEPVRVVGFGEVAWAMPGKPVARTKLDVPMLYALAVSTSLAASVGVQLGSDSFFDVPARAPASCTSRWHKPRSESS